MRKLSAVIAVAIVSSGLMLVAPSASFADEEDPCMTNPDGNMCEMTDLEEDDLGSAGADVPDLDAIEPVFDENGLIDIDETLDALEELYNDDPAYDDVTTVQLNEALDSATDGLEATNDDIINNNYNGRAASRGGGCYISTVRYWNKLKRFGFIPYFSAHRISGFVACVGDFPRLCQLWSTVGLAVPPTAYGSGIGSASRGGCFIDDTDPWQSGPRPTAGFWHSQWVGSSGTIYTTGVKPFVIT